MIDFHTHLLPGIDDGARNIRMTTAMLKECQRQEIEISVATPHFYFDKKIDKMIEKREKAYKKTEKYFAKKGECMPELILGFEVHLAPEIVNEPDLDRLVITGTNIMLVEMPLKRWDDDVFSRLDLLLDKGYDIVLAHPERYCMFAKEEEYDRLFSYKLPCQLNAASLISPTTRDYAIKMLSEGKISVLGSDAHNLGVRANFMKIASDLIKRKFGEYYIEKIEENASRLLGL